MESVVIKCLFFTRTLPDRRKSGESAALKPLGGDAQRPRLTTPFDTDMIIHIIIKFLLTS